MQAATETKTTREDKVENVKKVSEFTNEVLLNDQKVKVTKQAMSAQKQLGLKLDGM